MASEKRRRYHKLTLNMGENRPFLLRLWLADCSPGLTYHSIHDDQLGGIGNDYQVVGTLDRAEWHQEKQELWPFEQVREYRHNLSYSTCRLLQKRFQSHQKYRCQTRLSNEKVPQHPNNSSQTGRE